MGKCHLKGDNSGVPLHIYRLQITVNLNTCLPIGNHAADFPIETMIHNAQIAAFCLKEQFSVLLSLISGSAIAAVLIRTLGQETTPKHAFRRPREHSASILAVMDMKLTFKCFPLHLLILIIVVIVKSSHGPNN